MCLLYFFCSHNKLWLLLNTAQTSTRLDSQVLIHLRSQLVILTTKILTSLLASWCFHFSLTTYRICCVMIKTFFGIVSSQDRVKTNHKSHYDVLMMVLLNFSRPTFTFYRLTLFGSELEKSFPLFVLQFVTEQIIFY